MTAPWLSDDDYRMVRNSVPICCVDILPLRLRSGKVESVGLIKRATPHQGPRWCLVGGRMFHDESLAAAILRHMHTTLGNTVSLHVPDDIHPLMIGQYFTTPQPDHEWACWDPRQHSVALTFALAIEGQPTAMGEATAFEWFAPDAIPSDPEMGFDQHRVLRTLLHKLLGWDTHG